MESALDKTSLEDFQTGFVSKYVNFKGCILPQTYEFFANYIENFEIRDDDIWVCSFPKTGTTWTQEMVWNISNDLDFEGAKVSLPERFPALEIAAPTMMSKILEGTPQVKDDYSGNVEKIEKIAKLPSPRFIKTHLPFHLLPFQLRTQQKKAKIIYVTRNPKDACISYYHHLKLLGGYRGSYELFCKQFLANSVSYAPFWDHINGYWKNNNNKNILYLKYEDMKKDLSAIIRKTAVFLDKTLNDKQIHDLENHLSFLNMKKNRALNYHDLIEVYNKSKIFGEDYVCEGEFIRQGTVGQWKNDMSTDLIQQFDSWIAKELEKYPCLRNEFL